MNVPGDDVVVVHRHIVAVVVDDDDAIVVVAMMAVVVNDGDEDDEHACDVAVMIDFAVMTDIANTVVNELDIDVDVDEEDFDVVKDENVVEHDVDAAAAVDDDGNPW